jgi:hypothetical protein
MAEIDAKTDEELGFMARPLIQATLPHSKTPGTNYFRQNGNVVLEVRSSPIYGLPYGTIPRILLIWMTSEACKKKSRDLELGKTLTEFLRRLDFPVTGGARGYLTALKKQMDALFTSTFHIRYDVSGSKQHGLAHENIVPVIHYICWDSPKSASEDQMNLFRNEITLSKEFYQDIIKQPVPVDMRAIKMLRKSPLAIDVYEWLTLKNYSARRPVGIPWEALQLQFGASYPNTPRGRRNFKMKFLMALASVGQVYPDANKLQPETDHLLFIPGRPHIPAKF